MRVFSKRNFERPQHTGKTSTWRNLTIFGLGVILLICLIN